jgi:hypothetical protein
MLVEESGDDLLGDLRAALQSAIELEHSTIPVYLYALYSLDASRNAEIVEILQSAVVEEMLHMVLAANVLNAIGGAPSLDRDDFVPAYPSGLPGGVEDVLRVHLAPFSMAQLDALIEIEEPRAPITGLAPSVPEGIGSCTIGEFYASIEAGVARLAPDAFSGDPARQVGPELMLGSVAVTDPASAARAIETIIEQGEGSSSSPTETDSGTDADDYAHFYRLTQIQRGRRLVAVPLEGSTQVRYAYEGEPIFFDAAGVHGAPIDPRSRTYRPGSPERDACDTFNYHYTRLLGVLHALVNGHADAATFAEALELMRLLGRVAREMFTGVTVPGVPVGPSFEYLAAP